MKKIKLHLKKRTIIIGVIILVIFGGFLLRRNFVNQKNGDKETATIQRGTVKEELILSGEVQADEHVNLQFQVSGLLNWVGISEGDTVKKGQTIATLDSKALGVALQQAKNTLRQKEAALEEVYDDVKDNDDDESFTQKNTRTTAEVAKDNAYDAVVAAEHAFVATTLRSPIDGIVTGVANPFAGVNVLATQSAFEIVNPTTIYFDVAADQSDVTLLTSEQQVTITLDSFPETNFYGRIKNISLTPSQEEIGTVYKVKVELPEVTNAGVYRIGMTGDARFTLSQVSDVLYVPSTFVNSDDDGSYIYVGTPNNKVYVEIGLVGEEHTEIKGNIKEGDTIFD